MSVTTTTDSLALVEVLRALLKSRGIMLTRNGAPLDDLAELEFMLDLAGTAKDAIDSSGNWEEEITRVMPRRVLEAALARSEAA